MSEPTKAPEGKQVGTEDHPTGGAQEITEGQLTAGGPQSSDEVDSYASHGNLRNMMADVDPQEDILQVRRGMYGPGHGSGDVSGFGGLVRTVELGGQDAKPPFGGWFDDVADAMSELVPGFARRVAVWRDQITFTVMPDKLVELCRILRDDPRLRFEVCMSVSGAHFPGLSGRELHVYYQLLSYSYNRRISLCVETSDDDRHVPSITSVYPMANYHERETWDMFGVLFDGHPNLARILMPDDWVGHPQRKDYPLGGIPVEYKGAVVPPPDQRRSYQA